MRTLTLSSLIQGPESDHFLKRIQYKNNIMLVCTRRHGSHASDQEQKHLSVGTKRYFHVNSSRKNSIVLTRK